MNVHFHNDTMSALRRRCTPSLKRTRCFVTSFVESAERRTRQPPFLLHSPASRSRPTPPRGARSRQHAIQAAGQCRPEASGGRRRRAGPRPRGVRTRTGAGAPTGTGPSGASSGGDEGTRWRLRGEVQGDQHAPHRGELHDRAQEPPWPCTAVTHEHVKPEHPAQELGLGPASRDRRRRSRGRQRCRQNGGSPPGARCEQAVARDQRAAPRAANPRAVPRDPAGERRSRRTRTPESVWKPSARALLVVGRALTGGAECNLRVWCIGTISMTAFAARMRDRPIGGDDMPAMPTVLESRPIFRMWQARC